MVNMDGFSWYTFVFIRVGGNARENIGTETFILASKPVPPNMVTPVEAHYLKAWSPHCDLAVELNIVSNGPFQLKKKVI